MKNYYIDQRICVDANNRRLLVENDHKTLDDRVQVWAAARGGDTELAGERCRQPR